ncbi:BrnT family toxin [Azospirillum sp. INR13]|uniref:BrnT family toxin n=1 Tax=Azospirillum sp. INR13 TaxID=2596919 RepID=UPI001891FB54|nr:BrnT family toxin [Azospirillum sp. INR13]MBF5094404.1 BrnT family toxin [Azospirillum sp. INR13]
MKTPFDPAKNEINRAKHGLDLAFGSDVLRDPNLIEALDDRMDYGEERFNALGMVAGRIYAVTYTERADGVRFISVRAADKRETDRYFRVNS